MRINLLCAMCHYLFLSGCDKVKVRGHKCSFRVKLTMRLGFVDHWFVEIMGSHNCYIVSDREAGGGGAVGLESSPPPSDMDKMLADYELKSSDGEDSDPIGGLSQGIPSAESSPLMADSMAGMTQAGVINLLQNGIVDSRKFLPATPTPPPTDMSSSSSLVPPANLPTSSLSSSSFPMLLSPAHCPLGIPLFSDSYLEAMARNAAAAVAMSECRVIPPSPVSVSPLSSPLKKDTGIVTPSAALPNGLGLIGADTGGAAITGSFLPPPPMILPRFGFLPPLPLADGKQNLHIPMEDKVMDLSTPKQSKQAEAVDSGVPQDLSAKKNSSTNGHSSSLKRIMSPTDVSAHIFTDLDHKGIISRQASNKSPSSLPTPALTGNQKQVGLMNTGTTLPFCSSPQHQNGNIRGSNPKRQRKNTPCPSYSVTSFSKSSGLVLTRDLKSSISSPLFTPKQIPVHDLLGSTSSTTVPLVSSASGPEGNISIAHKSKSMTSDSNSFQEAQLSLLEGSPHLFPSSDSTGSLEDRQKKNGCSNLNASVGAYGKSDKLLDKVDNGSSIALLLAICCSYCGMF